MHQAFRPIAVMLGVILIITVPAQAGPVRLIDVIQTITDNDGARQNAQLQLRSISQQSDAQTASGVRSSGAKGVSQTNSTGSGVPAVVSGKGGIPQGGSRQDVETIQLGDVSGTICDCGEIAIAGGGFPLWPLLGLAAIPLAFIDFGGGGRSNPPFEVPTQTTPTPQPPPPGTPIPEPATLLLFGSGLLAMRAGIRRRRAADRLAEAESVAGKGGHS